MSAAKASTLSGVGQEPRASAHSQKLNHTHEYAVESLLSQSGGTDELKVNLRHVEWVMRILIVFHHFFIHLTLIPFPSTYYRQPQCQVSFCRLCFI